MFQSQLLFLDPVKREEKDLASVESNVETQLLLTICTKTNGLRLFSLLVNCCHAARGPLLILLSKYLLECSPVHLTKSSKEAVADPLWVQSIIATIHSVY